MLRQDFYRQAIEKINVQIEDAEYNGDLKRVAKLMGEKSRWEDRARKDGVEIAD